LKDLKISIDNSNDSWEVRNSPYVKKVSLTQFNCDILSGAQVFEIWAIYRPASEYPEEKKTYLPL
jgi:hypothetical protein